MPGLARLTRKAKGEEKMAIATGFRTAQRKQAKLRLGLAGPAGSGKTVSALLIAYGMTGDWSKIGLVDTENGSGELYAGATIGEVKIGNYQVLTLQPPYMPQKYIGTIHLAEEAGLEVIILDSISHAWAGEGGLLDLHGKISSSSKSGNSYVAWREVTPLHNQFVEAMLQSRIHVIATMRSKMEYALEKDKDGSTTVKKLGLAPVQREGMDYEFTTVLELSINHVASASKDRTNLFDGRYFKPSPEIGQQFKQWLEDGIAVPAPTNLTLAANSTSKPLPDRSGDTSRADGQVRVLQGQAEHSGGFPGVENDSSPAMAEEKPNRAHLQPIIQVIQKYHPDMEMVGNMAFELTGKRSPGELSGEEAGR